MTIRRLSLLALAAALAAPLTAHAAPRRPVGILITIEPTVLRNGSLDVMTQAQVTGAIVYPYVATFAMHGTVSGPGYTTLIEDRWTVVVSGNMPTPVQHHTYPATAKSDIALQYTGYVGGVVTATMTPCNGAFYRLAGQKPYDTKSC
jgi:hypothetical protein